MNAAAPVLHTCEHYDAGFRAVADKAPVIPLPPQCDAPLPKTAGAFLKLREKADRVAFIALPEIKPTFRP